MRAHTYTHTGRSKSSKPDPEKRAITWSDTLIRKISDFYFNYLCSLDPCKSEKCVTILKSMHGLELLLFEYIYI